MKPRPDADATLKQAGLRRTPVRVRVLELLARADRPLSVPRMLSRLRGLDSVTVYRTLTTFADKGLVHKVRGEDRSWLYALSLGNGEARGATGNGRASHRHPHFVCDACGNVECLSGSEIPQNFVQSLGVGPAYSVTYPEVVLHGVCPRCHA